MLYERTFWQILEHLGGSKGIDQTRVREEGRDVTIDHASRPHRSHFGERQIGGGRRRLERDQARVQVEARCTDLHHVCETRRGIRVAILFLLPGTLLHKLHVRRFLEPDNVVSGFHIEAVIAVAVGRGLLEESPVRVV
jgi:hypothetical protein